MVFAIDDDKAMFLRSDLRESILASLLDVILHDGRLHRVAPERIIPAPPIAIALCTSHSILVWGQKTRRAR
jgi:hypothetical protein